MRKLGGLLQWAALAWAVGWVVTFGLGDWLPYPLELVTSPFVSVDWADRVWEWATFVPAVFLFVVGHQIRERRAPKMRGG